MHKIKEYQFLMEELVKRDFKKKYKGTVLGMLWSILNPLLMLVIMKVVFTHFFGGKIEHYTTFLFCGNIVFNCFSESTTEGMMSLKHNAGIFTKVNVPKWIFVLSKNSQTFINFLLTVLVFFILCIFDGITFTWKFVFLLYPIILLLVFNIGVGLILSALQIFFGDMQYLWTVFVMLLTYVSAIFYDISTFPDKIQKLFLCNPVYLFIRYFRKIVIDGAIPSVWFHLLMLGMSLVALGVGALIYKKNNTEFLYYV